MILAAQRALTPDEMQNIAKMAGGIAQDKEAIQAIISSYGYEPATDNMRLALQLIAISEIHGIEALVNTIETESSYHDVVGAAVAIAIKIGSALSGLIGSGIFKGGKKKQAAAALKIAQDIEAQRQLERIQQAAVLAKKKADADKKAAEEEARKKKNRLWGGGAILIIIVVGLILANRS